MLVSESCLLYWLNLLQYYNLKDIDECSVNSDVCGFGTCTNNPNREFYMCECEDGAVLGTNSDNLPTCFGMEVMFLPSKLIECLFVKQQFSHVNVVILC